MHCSSMMSEISFHHQSSGGWPDLSDKAEKILLLPELIGMRKGYVKLVAIFSDFKILQDIDHYISAVSNTLRNVK